MAEDAGSGPAPRGSSPTEPSGELAAEVERHINQCEWCQARYLLKTGSTVDDFLHALRAEVEEALHGNAPQGRHDTGGGRTDGGGQAGEGDD